VGIREKIEDLRNEFRKRYGMEVEVRVHIYDTRNKIDPETAERVAAMVAKDMDAEMSDKLKPIEEENDDDPRRWYNIDCRDRSAGCTVFFQE